MTMNKTRNDFARMVTNSKLSSTQKFVAITLAILTSDKTGKCRIAMSRLQDLTSYSRSTVKRALKFLEDIEAITCERDEGYVSSYSLNPDVDLSGIDTTNKHKGNVDNLVPNYSTS